MNRLRVRVGETIRVFCFADGVLCDTLTVEDAIDRVLDSEYHFGPYQLVALGEFAYDIRVDDRKVGHAKAYTEKPKSDKPTELTLWQWFLLTIAAYVALL